MVKGCTIALVIAAVVIFLALSSRIFNLSVSDPKQYQKKYNTLSTSEKNMIKSMKKTGEVQSKVIGTRRNTGGNGRFLDEVEKIHRKDKADK